MAVIGLPLLVVPKLSACVAACRAQTRPIASGYLRRFAYRTGGFRRDNPTTQGCTCLHVPARTYGRYTRSSAFLTSGVRQTVVQGADGKHCFLDARGANKTETVQTTPSAAYFRGRLRLGDETTEFVYIQRLAVCREFKSVAAGEFV